MSLDGFVCGPEGETQWIFSGDQTAIAWKVERLSNAGLIAMGSRSFRDMAAYWPTSTTVFAPPMNRTPKAVFSKQGAAILKAAAVATAPADAQFQPGAESWAQAYVAGGDLAEEIAGLKAQDETPIVALGGAAREAMRLADVLETMLHGARDALHKGDRKVIAETRRMDDVLDHLNTAIKTYLTSLDPESLSDADHRRLGEILNFAMNMEQAGDVVDRNLLPHCAKRMKRGLEFSKEGEAELLAMMDRLVTNLRTAASLFMTDDRRAARLLVDEKVTFRDLEAAATQSHFDRLRAGRRDTAETSALHLDLLRDMKRVNGHIVAAAAYPVLERSGELLPSRVTEGEANGEG